MNFGLFEFFGTDIPRWVVAHCTARDCVDATVNQSVIDQSVIDQSVIDECFTEASFIRQ